VFETNGSIAFTFSTLKAALQLITKHKTKEFTVNTSNSGLPEV